MSPLKKTEGMTLRLWAIFTIFWGKTCKQAGIFHKIKWPKSEEKPKMGVGGVMALKVTGILTIIEITQKTSGPPSQISLQEALVWST